MSPTGKSFRFVRACERARRGEAVWASERRFDSGARAVLGENVLLLLLLPRNHAGCPPVVRGQLLSENIEKQMVFQQFSRTTRGQPCKTYVKPTFFADNLVKPM